MTGTPACLEPGAKTWGTSRLSPVLQIVNRFIVNEHTQDELCRKIDDFDIDGNPQQLVHRSVPSGHLRWTFCFTLPS
jgi:hypothetical protein